MPSLFRATVGLREEHWIWHRSNPGQLSRLAQQAIDQRIAIESLPESAVDRASDEAETAFFARYPIEGSYAICDDRIVRHHTTEEQMAADASALEVPVERFLDLLGALYDLDIEASLRRQAIFYAARR